MPQVSASRSVEPWPSLSRSMSACDLDSSRPIENSSVTAKSMPASTPEFFCSQSKLPPTKSPECSGENEPSFENTRAHKATAPLLKLSITPMRWRQVPTCVFIRLCTDGPTDAASVPGSDRPVTSMPSANTSGSELSASMCDTMPKSSVTKLLSSSQLMSPSTKLPATESPLTYTIPISELRSVGRSTRLTLIVPTVPSTTLPSMYR